MDGMGVVGPKPHASFTIKTQLDVGKYTVRPMELMSQGITMLEFSNSTDSTCKNRLSMQDFIWGKVVWDADGGNTEDSHKFLTIPNCLV